jgi:hypothetical protein
MCEAPDRPVSLACWAHSERSEIDTEGMPATQLSLARLLGPWRCREVVTTLAAAASCDSLTIRLSGGVARDSEFQHLGFLLAGDLHSMCP